nr:hypothetical protein GCM10020092_008720 [Actinoplanes digitatis]
MGLRINQNIAAQNAYRNLSVTDTQMGKSLEKLSSGFRINRAADDAAQPRHQRGPAQPDRRPQGRRSQRAGWHQRRADR